MKLQYIAVIFILIILPINLVLTAYINNQIDTLKLQTTYTAALNTATYDALKAFQINVANNKYSSISDSKIRDIEASVNTFYNSLGTAMQEHVSSKNDVKAFVPAVLFTLYDGYYIYSSYNNRYSTTDIGGDTRVQIQDTNNYQEGLRPYIYYSCKYALGSDIIVVNYTLDNYITVYGNLKNEDGTKKYQTRSGYLINPGDVTAINTSTKKLVYKGVTIGPETLTEHLLTIEERTDGTQYTEEKDYQYIVYNNQKVYYDSAKNDYFWYQDYKKTYLQSEKTNLIAYLNKNNVGFKSISAYEYYYNAYIFSNWVVNVSGLSNIQQSNVIKFDGGNTQIGSDTTYLASNTGNTYIFRANSTNDPMLSSSDFNEHRMSIIRKSIETNLTTAIVNYNLQSGGTYEFAMPVIDEENWYNITNKVTLVSFMQGLPIGQKYFNNYAIVTNTRNEEVINEQSIYILGRNSDGNYEYHQPGCRELIEKTKAGQITNLVAYTDLSFARQTVKINEVQNKYFYPQARVGKTTTGCYNCIVNASADYDIDSIISGTVKNYLTNSVIYNSSDLMAVRKAYLTGLARERQDLYKSNSL